MTPLPLARRRSHRALRGNACDGTESRLRERRCELCWPSKRPRQVDSLKGDWPPRRPRQRRRSMELWVGWVASALEDDSYREKLARKAFEAVNVEPTRVYEVADAKAVPLRRWDRRRARAAQIDGRFSRTKALMRKPAAATAAAKPRAVGSSRNARASRRARRVHSSTAPVPARPSKRPGARQVHRSPVLVSSLH